MARPGPFGSRPAGSSTCASGMTFLIAVAISLYVVARPAATL